MTLLWLLCNPILKRFRCLQLETGLNWDFKNHLAVWPAPKSLIVRVLVNPSRFLSILLETSVTLRAIQALMLSRWKWELPQDEKRNPCLWYDTGEVGMVSKLGFIAWLKDQLEQKSLQIASVRNVNVKIISYVYFLFYCIFLLGLPHFRLRP